METQLVFGMNAAAIPPPPPTPIHFTVELFINDNPRVRLEATGNFHTRDSSNIEQKFK